ncbi:hypothetical protein BPOR_0021g00180 [Botrytis porri]|uniref:Uncharacterized protein n=1 Tax=Botrytis porri TaxID=87229 RepID=A0A4Z1L595_9HELO|nr:hypothetical protein BPOR_0021g00180 [Botrytis porri]
MSLEKKLRLRAREAIVTWWCGGFCTQYTLELPPASRILVGEGDAKIEEKEMMKENFLTYKIKKKELKKKVDQ